MTQGDLQTATRKKLAQMARRQRISGWHSMRKDELVDALIRLARRDARRDQQSPSPASGRERCRLQPARRCDRGGPIRDQLVVEEVDERWLRAKWVLSERILDRARVALGGDWSQAVPVLRIYDVTERNGAAAEREFVKDEEIRQPMEDWIFPVENSTLSYRVELGYRTPQGAFFVLARSARVRTPQLGGMRVTVPEHSPSNGPSGQARGNGKGPSGKQPIHRGSSGDTGEQVFEIHAELVLHGRANPRAQLTLLGEPVQPHADGTFAVRMSLDDGRQVIPAVCVAPNGWTQRTIVLAIERNTKHLDPMPLNEPA